MISVRRYSELYCISGVEKNWFTETIIKHGARCPEHPTFGDQKVKSDLGLEVSGELLLKGH